MIYKLLTLLVFLSFVSFSQQNDSIEFKGKMYKIYPYATSKYGVFPIIESLPDGEYASFSMDNRKKVEGKWVKVKPFLDSTHVASVFQVKNGKKNGYVKVYNREEELLSEGYYENDLQNGKWILYTDKDEINHFNLKNGMVDGPYFSLNRKGDTLQYGLFKEGAACGIWKSFHSKESYSSYSRVNVSELPDSLFTSYPKGYIPFDYDVQFYSKGYHEGNATCFISKYEEWDHEGPYRNHGFFLNHRDDGTIDSTLYHYGDRLFKIDTSIIEVEVKEHDFRDTLYHRKDSLNIKKTTETLIEDSLYIDRFYYESGELNGEVKYARFEGEFKGNPMYQQAYETVSKMNKEKQLRFKSLIDKYQNEKKDQNRFYYAKRYSKSGVLVDSICYDSEYDYQRALYNVHFDEKTNKKLIVYVKDTVKQVKSFLRLNLKGDTLAYIETDYPEDSGFARVFDKGDLIADIRFKSSNNFLDVTFYKNGRLLNGEIEFNQDKYFGSDYGDISLPFKEFIGQNEISSNADHFKGMLKNGKVHGQWICSHDKNIVSKLNFNEGVYEGEQLFYSRPPWRSKTKEWYLALSKNYSNGKLDGYKNFYFSNGQLKYKSFYVNGKATSDITGYYDDGVQKVEVRPIDEGFEYRFLSYGFPSKIYHFTDSAGLEYLASQYRYTFKKDLRNGAFFNYDQMGNIAIDGHYTNGELDSVWTAWYDTGIKKKTVELNMDTLTLDGRYLDFNYERMRRRENSKGDEKQGLNTYFYSNGNISHKGEVYKGERIGEWKFYNETGSLIKRIQYERDTFNYVVGNDTSLISHYGYYESWYDNGVKQTEGYILDETAEFDCAQESYLKMQEMFYLNHWEQDSSQTLVHGTGLFTSYHNTGKWSSHGRFKNGQEEGQWYYWSPDGALTKTGVYQNGMKHGRWLQGDVDGSAYVDKACYRPEGFASDQEYEDYLAELSKNVEIIEEFYFKGVVVTRTKHLAFLK